MFLLGSVTVFVFMFLVVLAADVSAAPAPLWAERQIATFPLSSKIRLSHPKKTAPTSVDAGNLQHSFRAVSAQLFVLSWNAGWQAGELRPDAVVAPPQYFRDAPPIPAWQAAYIIHHGIRWAGMLAFPNFTEDDL